MNNDRKAAVYNIFFKGCYSSFMRVVECEYKYIA